MGSNCSQLTCDSVCNCFVRDENVQHVEVERDFQVKWLWTEGHDSILMTILTEPEYDYNAPTVIVELIKALSYSDKASFYVTQKHLCGETFYAKQTTLLNKKLCTGWYHSRFSNLSPFPIVVVSSDKKASVQMGESAYYQTTIHVNNCQIAMDVSHTDNLNNESNYYYVYFYKTIYIILINKNDSMECIDNVCRSIWEKCGTMDNCILVWNEKRCKTESGATLLLAKKWNVPSVAIDCRQPNSIKNLFKFAMKYYWFCEVTK